MDDETAMNASKAKGEATNKIKNGYLQLAEKMEQVKMQVAKMERKYDELYETVKAKEHSRNSSMISEAESKEEAKSQRESIDDTSITQVRSQVVEEPAPVETPEIIEEKAQPSRTESRVDFEKMENNPFL